jgi:hypothetical protein
VVKSVCALESELYERELTKFRHWSMRVGTTRNIAGYYKPLLELYFWGHLTRAPISPIKHPMSQALRDTAAL